VHFVAVEVYKRIIITKAMELRMHRLDAPGVIARHVGNVIKEVSLGERVDDGVVPQWQPM
jgi:hypothetical protein